MFWHLRKYRARTVRIFTAIAVASAGAFAQQTTAPPSLDPVRTSITVVERLETEAPAFVSVVSREELREQPGVNIDDRLRAVPGFTLFRRSSSLVANPTTQGVSLRGLGSSGASRTLVLWDGIPINDPFGGWVYWTRVDPQELERIEVARGAATSVFGDRAMSGAIALFSRTAEPWRLTGSYEGGNKNTHMATAGLSHLWSRFAASGQVRGFTSDGYFIVPEQRRGAVDTPANVKFLAGDTRFDFLGGSDRLFLKLDILAEHRDNGTTLTENSTGLGNIGAHYSKQLTSDTFSVLGYHTREAYRATFSAVAADRNSERLTFLQRVPSEAVGAAGMWQHRASQWGLLAGADMQRVEGTSTDTLIPTGLRVGGGSQFQEGTFVQFEGSGRSTKVFFGGRQQFTGRGTKFFSPNAGFSIGRNVWRARGSVYRSFRAPTLNELFRDFRAGNAETRANGALVPETMFGAEAGLDIVGEQGRVAITFFRHQIDNIITNVTLSTTPQLIVRQRQNAAEALTRGIDVSWDRHLTANLRGELGYLFSDSRFSTRLRIPQVPRHSGSAQLTYARRGTLLSAGLRSFSHQFEDDLNRFLMGGFATLQIAARQEITSGLSAQLAIDNLLGRQYPVGVTAPAAAGLAPLYAIGAPRLWRAGLRWDGRVR
jgi:outer membrane receptor protein involved in Fe transport